MTVKLILKSCDIAFFERLAIEQCPHFLLFILSKQTLIFKRSSGTFFFLWKEVFKSSLELRKRRIFFHKESTYSQLQKLTKNHFHGRIRTFYLQLLCFLDPSLSLSVSPSSLTSCSLFTVLFFMPNNSFIKYLIHPFAVGGSFLLYY